MSLGKVVSCVGNQIVVHSGSVKVPSLGSYVSVGKTKMRVSDIIGRVDDPYFLLKPPKDFNSISLLGREL